MNVIDSGGIGIGLAARPVALAAGDELGEALDESGPEPQEAINSRTKLAMTGCGALGRTATTTCIRKNKARFRHDSAGNRSVRTYAGIGNVRLSASQVGERLVKASTGAFVYIPAGTIHTFRHSGDGDGRMLTVCSPGGIEAVFMAPDAETKAAAERKLGAENDGPLGT